MTERAEKAWQILEGARGRFVSARFVKRTTGEVRDLVGRAGVTKYRRGGELKFDPKQRDLYPVFDTQKNDYRFINLDGLQQLKVDGTTYNFDDNGNITIEGRAPESANLMGMRVTPVYQYDEEVGF